MNRKLISRSLSNISDAYIAESMTCPNKKTRCSPERTSEMGKYENTRRGGYSRRLLGLILAACLVFSLAITAYAANIGGIRELFRTQTRELPEAADPYIQHHTETAAAEEWSARITESLCDSSRIMVTVNISVSDKYILVPTEVMDVTSEGSVGVIGIAGEQTLKEYAESKGKELLFVSASMMRNENLGIFTETYRPSSVSETEATILVDAVRTIGDTAGDAVCLVYAMDEAGNSMELELPFTLVETPAVDGEAVYVPVDPDAIPGMTVGEATIKDTPLGINCRWMETITDMEARDTIMKVEIEGITYREGGAVLADDGNCYFQFSMGQGTVGDTMTAHFYDWDKQLIGDIVFKKK